MVKKILITSALPYANGPLHFGHVAGAYLPADCYARFERMRGHEVLYICGSDEYGVAITLSAEMAKRTPKAHADEFHAINKALFDKLAISFDHFSRTTCQEHVPLVQEFFLDLKEQGYIDERTSAHLFSEPDQRFLADRYVVGTCPECGFEEARGDECGKCGASYEATDLKNPRSKLTNAPLTLRETTHWFLKFDQFTKQLEKFLLNKPWKPNVVNFAKRYLEDLRARAITRDLEWGVPVPLPEAKDKVFYVWFDAPLGYISATQEWARLQSNPDVWKDYWLDPKTKYVQFLGKDNIPFHAIFFPAMIMGQSTPYKLVDDLVANEFYNLEGKQFSKSEGWTIDLDDFFTRFHADQIRYTIAANAPESGDAEFTWKDFQKRCNAELLGKFGNLINRVLVFIQQKCEGKIPTPAPFEEVDLRFENQMHVLLQEIEEAFANYRLRLATQKIMELAQAGNTYFDAKMPWKDAKDPERFSYMHTTLYLCLTCIKNLSLVATPIIPTTAQKISEMLAIEPPVNWHQGLELALTSGTVLPKPTILFQKIEDFVIDKEIEKLQSMKEPPAPPEISFDEFKKMDLRIAQILEAKPVPKSKRLMQLTVDIGTEKRTVVSGIQECYTADELIGQKVMVIVNLKPTKIMGIESQGMVLTGTMDDHFELLTFERFSAGAEIS